jgi:YHS domain-containing protein
MSDTKNLASSIDAAFSAMEQKRKQIQTEETKKHQDWQQRLERISGVFDSLRDIWKPRLEVLMHKFGDKVTATPRLEPSSRNVELRINSELARIVLRFQATTDYEMRKIILNYDLQIIPILMKYDSHAELEMPADSVDREAVGRWIDERILSFVKTYVALHENPFYLRDHMVEDPVTGVRFPKLLAGAKIDKGGRTYYFISDETRREFEERGAKKA